MPDNPFQSASSAQDCLGFREVGRSTKNEMNYRKQLNNYAVNSSGTIGDKFENFSKYITRQSAARYLALYEIFKIILPIQGDIIEGGVNWGGGLMWFAQMSATLEPFNLQRKIIGFDTFSGFPNLHSHDTKHAEVGKEHREGGYQANSFDDLMQCIEIYDQNRAIGHVSKVRLIRGDACETMPQYLIENPHTIVSLLHLDFDIYSPTKIAIDTFLQRMPKGAVILFDELNCPKWPGETQAVVESLLIQKLRVQRFTFEPYISYAVVE
ncbi:dTDP-6-deoxy-L-hexose 3-O-methyltransferase [Chromatium weissei]|nr:dTDP-6-deoxy-L-hexose 3-O-methyltransferase [Chromatium weissei]